MVKYAKWIGGGLGWAFGGPIGAIFGYALGSLFDNTQVYTYNAIYESSGGDRTQSGDFHASLLVLSAAIMKADGRILKSELDYVKKFLTQQFGSDKASEMILSLREIVKQEIPLQDVCRQIRHFMQPSSNLQLIHFLFGISGADGEIHPKEIEMIKEISSLLGIGKKDFESIQAMFIKHTDNDYKILEIDPEATNEEVKKAYRKMAVKYHPDKVIHLGEDVQKAANEKFQKVQEAYENIKKSRKMS